MAKKEKSNDTCLHKVWGTRFREIDLLLMVVTLASRGLEPRLSSHITVESVSTFTSCNRNTHFPSLTNDSARTRLCILLYIV